jgi:hypothetical protein
MMRGEEQQEREQARTTRTAAATRATSQAATITRNFTPNKRSGARERKMRSITATHTWSVTIMKVILMT